MAPLICTARSKQASLTHTLGGGGAGVEVGDGVMDDVVGGAMDDVADGFFDADRIEEDNDEDDVDVEVEEEVADEDVEECKDDELLWVAYRMTKTKNSTVIRINTTRSTKKHILPLRSRDFGR